MTGPSDTKTRASGFLFLCLFLPLSFNCQQEHSIDDSLSSADAYDDVIRFEFGGKQNVHEAPVSNQYVHQNPGSPFVIDIARDSGRYWLGQITVNTPICQQGELTCNNPKYDSSELRVQLYYLDTSSYDHPSDVLILEGCHSYGHCDLRKFDVDPNNALHAHSGEFTVVTDTINGRSESTYRKAEFGAELSSSYDIARLVIYSSTGYIEVALGEDEALTTSGMVPL